MLSDDARHRIPGLISRDYLEKHRDTSKLLIWTHRSQILVRTTCILGLEHYRCASLTTEPETHIPRSVQHATATRDHRTSIAIPAPHISSRRSEILEFNNSGTCVDRPKHEADTRHKNTTRVDFRKHSIRPAVFHTHTRMNIFFFPPQLSTPLPSPPLRPCTKPYHASLCSFLDLRPFRRINWPGNTSISASEL